MTVTLDEEVYTREGTLRQRKRPNFRAKRYWKSPNCKKGANNHMAKIHKSVVNYIRENYRPYRVMAKDLASKFGLHPHYVRQIIAGVTWKERGVERKGQYRALTDDQAKAVRKSFENGYSICGLAKSFKCNKGTINSIVKNRTYLRSTAGFKC